MLLVVCDNALVHPMTCPAMRPMYSQVTRQSVALPREKTRCRVWGRPKDGRSGGTIYIRLINDRPSAVDRLNTA